MLMHVGAAAVAAALRETKPPILGSIQVTELIEQWRADVLAIGWKLAQAIDGFDRSAFDEACGGIL